MIHKRKKKKTKQKTIFVVYKLCNSNYQKSMGKGVLALGEEYSNCAIEMYQDHSHGPSDVVYSVQI